MAYKALALWNFAAHGSRLDAMDLMLPRALALLGTKEAAQNHLRDFTNVNLSQSVTDGIDGIDP